jgi:hypothetical protein
MSFANGGRIITSGLVLALDASDVNSYPGSGTIWTDLSGNNNSGSLINGPTFDSGNGGSIVFNGTNNNVTFTATINSVGMYQNNFSNEFWFKPNSITQGALLAADGSPVAGGQYAVILRSTSILVSFYGQDQGGALPSTNIWYHFVNTYNYTTKSSIMYVNGSLFSTLSRTFDLGPSVQNSTLKSGIYGFGGSYFNGSLASVKIYNKALSASEVLQNYNAQKSRFNLK